MNPEQRRPQVGEEVWCRGVVREGKGRSPTQVVPVHFPSGYSLWFQESDITTVPPAAPAPPPPRPEWEAWRDVAEWMTSKGWRAASATIIEAEADRMEAAARPVPPPTLAEAVKAYADAFNGPSTCGTERTAMFEALAREPGA